MNKGESVKVKQGFLDPDFNKFDMSGWQGRIINTDNKTKLVDIEWDSITLRQLPKAFIEYSVKDGCDYASMWLGIDEIELSCPRDNKSDVKKEFEKLEKLYDGRCFDEEEKRISAILPEDNLSVNVETQNIYYDFLQKNLEKPTILTGSEDFSWEEKYLLGGWSKKEYEEMKKDHPSYTDKFEFIELTDIIDDLYGIIVKVRRISDKKRFELPLCDLKCCDRKSKNYNLISDYSFWMTNYR